MDVHHTQDTHPLTLSLSRARARSLPLLATRYFAIDRLSRYRLSYHDVHVPSASRLISQLHLSSVELRLRPSPPRSTRMVVIVEPKDQLHASPTMSATLSVLFFCSGREGTKKKPKVLELCGMSVSRFRSLSGFWCS